VKNHQQPDYATGQHPTHSHDFQNHTTYDNWSRLNCK